MIEGVLICVLLLALYATIYMMATEKHQERRDRWKY